MKFIVLLFVTFYFASLSATPIQVKSIVDADGDFAGGADVLPMNPIGGGKAKSKSKSKSKAAAVAGVKADPDAPRAGAKGGAAAAAKSQKGRKNQATVKEVAVADEFEVEGEGDVRVENDGEEEEEREVIRPQKTKAALKERADDAELAVAADADDEFAPAEEKPVAPVRSKNKAAVNAGVGRRLPVADAVAQAVEEADNVGAENPLAAGIGGAANGLNTRLGDVEGLVDGIEEGLDNVETELGVDRVNNLENELTEGLGGAVGKGAGGAIGKKQNKKKTNAKVGVGAKNNARNGGLGVGAGNFL